MAHWLVKSEPDAYSIDDLARDRVTHWHGVRNYLARNHLCAMEPGDLVLYYHSNADPIGIVGVAKVTKKAYPDPSQFEKKGDHYDPKATAEKPRWFCPDLTFVKKYPKIITLDLLRQTPDLAKLELLRRGSRLSVLPVSAAEFAIIEKLGAGK